MLALVDQKYSDSESNRFGIECVLAIVLAIFHERQYS
jgi:hypothetical protein